MSRLYATIAFNSGVKAYGVLPELGVYPGLLNVSTCTFSMDVFRAIQNPSFSVEFDNTNSSWAIVLAGSDKNIIGRVIVIREGSDYASSVPIMSGGIRAIDISTPDKISLNCDRNKAYLDEERGRLIKRTIFPACHDNADGQWMAYPCTGYNSDAFTGGDQKGQITAWRIDTNLYLIGIMSGGSKALSKVYDQNEVDITASCSLTTGVYPPITGATYDLIAYTSADPFIYVSVTDLASIPFVFRDTQFANYIFDNLDGIAYAAMIANFAAMGYDGTYVSVLNQGSKKNCDFIVELAAEFDCFVCPHVDSAYPDLFYFHLKQMEYKLTADYTPDLVVNYAWLKGTYKPEIDYTKIHDEIQRKYRYQYRLNKYNRQPVDCELPTAWSSTTGFFDSRNYIRHQNSYKAAMRYLFFWNKPKEYVTFTLDFDVCMALDTCGQLIQLTAPEGNHPNVMRILMVMSFVVSPMERTKTFRCLDISTIVDNMLNIKFFLQSNTFSNNDVLFFDFSPDGKTVITPYGAVKHSLAQKKFGYSSVDFDGSTAYLSCSPAPAILAQTNFTISMWLMNTNLGVFAVPFGKYQDATHYWGLGWQADNKCYWVHTVSGGTVQMVSNVAINDTKWHHYMICRVSTTRWGLYIDGAQVAYLTNSDIQAFAADFVIGNFAGTYWFKGQIAELRISYSNDYNALPSISIGNGYTVPTALMTWEA